MVGLTPSDRIGSDGIGWGRSVYCGAGLDERCCSYDRQDRPEVSNLVGMYACLAGCSVETVCADASLCNRGHRHFKKQLAELLVQQLRPVRQAIVQLQSERAYVEQLLRHGSVEARVLAEQTWQQVRCAAGFT